MFQVTLYDSGSEDDGATMEDPQVLMTLSDRFIQEVTLNGDVSIILHWLTQHTCTCTVALQLALVNNNYNTTLT